METIMIVGMREVDFTDKDGRSVHGWSFYFTMEDSKVIGVMAGKVFVSADKLAFFSHSPSVGDTVRVMYNRFGKPEDFVLVTKK